jgi:class 3 adenylate cyclase
VAEDRRVVTVLFADVADSTGLADDNDPEEVRAVLGRYYETAREVIGAHGGTVEKFIGDAVMAVFGVPQAHGDDAERALIAALALRDAVARDPRTAALCLRFGVNTGEVVAARQAQGDFLVTGDAVNVAARLQQHADAGAILVGERTVRAVSAFRFSPPSSITVKGKHNAVIAAVLLERVMERRAHGPFLGREHDLAQLDLVARRAYGERRPQLVTITAPAGTGKSRLVEEFASRLASDVTVATAQCLPYGAAITSVPLQGLARGLLRIGQDAPILPGLHAAFASAGYGQADGQRLASFISATIGDATESEPGDRDEIFAAWRLLIEALASRGALLVVFEDLHWASDTLLDLVEYVTISRTAAPLVMVALARAELLDRRPSWGGGRRNFTSIALEPLSQADTLQLVTLLANRTPSVVAERIAERAGGNPFFVLELVRAYEERQRAGLAGDEINLPDTVHATVLARIDTLPSAQRSVLEYAAIAGRTARASTIGVLLPDLGKAEVDAALGALADGELLAAQAGDAYTFAHIVIREVAYATLPRAARVRAHLQLARSHEPYAASGARDGAELVAFHYRQAVALSPGGRIPEGLSVGAVVDALERVARIASAAGAHGEAAQQIQEAIRLAPTPERLRLFELLGDLMQFGDEAVQAYAEAFEHWRAAGASDPRVGARLLIRQLSVIGRWSGSLARMLEQEEFDALADQARTLLDRSPDSLLEAQLGCAVAFNVPPSLLSDESVAQHIGSATAARQLFASLGDAEAESEALDAIGGVHRRAGDFAAALVAQRERLAISEHLGLLERIDAWSVGVWDLVNLGRFGDAIQMFRDACAALRVGEPEYMLSHALAWAIYAAALNGRWDDAIRLGDKLLDNWEHWPRNVGRFTSAGWIGMLRVASARLDETRLARYRSAFATIANLDRIAPTWKPMFQAIIQGDAALARVALARPAGARDRKAELVAMLLFDLGERLSEEEIEAIERQVRADPLMLTLRLQLARALNADEAALRSALTALDQTELVADAARASALLALRTREARDLAEARRRLTLLGDQAYLLKLAEEW